LLKLGHDVEFYRLLEAQAEVAQRAAQAFLSFAQDFTGLDAKAKALRDLEHEGDALTRKLQNKILSTFITPLDKEDLRDLSMALDDVTDAIEAAASRAALYRLESVRRDDLVAMGEVLVSMTGLIVVAARSLEKNLHVQEAFAKNVEDLHKLEKEGDRLHRRAVMELFDTPGIDPLTVMKWKEVYDITEDAFDVAENVAKVLGDILTKYA
jgi:predicted phosphate transport protein (TIGR00153 family)